MTEGSEDRWLAEIATGRAGWIRFYKELLHRPLSIPHKFWTALEVYGTRAMYEAVIATAIRRIDGDPLNYVISVGRSMWKEQQDQAILARRYYRDVELAKASTAKESDRLADKIKRARENKSKDELDSI